MNNITISHLSGATQMRQTSNQIIIVDCSGSMSPHVRSLRTAIMDLVQRMHEDDHLTIIRFSTDKDASFVVRLTQPRAISDASLAKLLEKEIYADGLTGIAYPFEIIAKEIENFMVFNEPIVLSFLTDGYPVPGGQERRIMDVCKKLGADISEATIFGFGDYYNRNLLLEMAAALEGTQRHLEDMDEYRGGLDDAHLGEHGSNIEVEIPDGDDIALSVVGGKVIQRTINNDGNRRYISVPDVDQEIYTLKNGEIPSCKTDEELPLAYALAAMAMQNGDTTAAVSFLAKTGDKFIIDEVLNSFTTAELGLSQALVEQATSDSTVRYQNGKNKSYLPSRTAFCLLDLMQVLRADGEAKFYPMTGDFEYKRSSMRHKSKETLGEMIYDKDQGVLFKDLVWSSEELNLSVRATFKGTMIIGSNNVGLPEQLPVVFYRNYAFVVDGAKNVLRVPMSVSEKTFAVLKKRGLVASSKQWEPGKIFSVSLKRLPVMNRAMADSVSVNDMVQMAIDEMGMKSKQKVLNFMLKDLKEAGELSTVFTPDQVLFLKDYGISDKGVWSPPTEEVPSGDVRIARRFKLKIAGASSLPSISDVNEALKKKGDPELLTPIQKVMFDNMVAFNGLDAEQAKQTLDDLKFELSLLSSAIAEQKMVMLLTGYWPFKSRKPEDCALEYEGWKVAFALDDIEIQL